MSAGFTHIRPLKRQGDGVYLSSDGRWRFVRDDWHTAGGRPSWWAYEVGNDEEAANIGMGHQTLTDVVAWAERQQLD